MHFTVLEDLFAFLRVGKQLEIFRQRILKPWIDKSQRFTVFVALMSIEKHQHTQVPKVAFAEALAVKTVNLRVSQDVANSLEIDDHQIALSDLP
jgi:hypothetical protein